MAGSTFGTLFRVTTWGESHGKAIGAVVDGCPAGLDLCEEKIQEYLDRRKPGQNRYTTARREADSVEILYGVFEGKTEGTPISMMVRNTDQHSRDYSEIARYYRPGHADLTFDRKYGVRDYRGGGRSSGRETIGRVCGGAIAAAVLKEMGITVTAWTASIGTAAANPDNIGEGLKNMAAFRRKIMESELFMPDPEAEKKAQAYLEKCIQNHDSSGGSVECLISGMKSGAGEPVFDKLDAELGKAMFSIGAVKAVDIGAGRNASMSRGSLNNDMYLPDGRKKSNNAGGILGGISEGSSILLRVYFKPTPSIAQTQQALFQDGSVRNVQIKGRHDPVIVPRAVVVVESMAAMTVLDLLLRNMTSRLDEIMRFYKNEA